MVSFVPGLLLLLYMDIYLTAERKVDYMADFARVLAYEAPVWGLDSELHELLSRINANPHIQTLYSQRYYPGKTYNPDRSYLRFAYAQEVEQQLFKVLIPQLVEQFVGRFDAYCYYGFSYPKDNLVYAEEAGPDAIGCLNDPDYFRINQIDLYLESGSLAEHLVFWERLGEELCVLGEAGTK
jgi:hypothetical protein